MKKWVIFVVDDKQKSKNFHRGILIIFFFPHGIIYYAIPYPIFLISPLIYRNENLRDVLRVREKIVRTQV